MKIIRLAAVGVVAALALTACGNDSSDKGSGDAAAGGKTKVRLWLNGTDTPEPVRQYAIAEFAKQHPDAQARHRAAGVGRPGRQGDDVAVRQRQPGRRRGRQHAGRGLRSAGAFQDITAKKADLGGDDLLKGFVDAGAYDGKCTPRRTTPGPDWCSTARTC
ncbi:hypothetical protein GCM10025868_44100 [Angustibacter aerolatus]|uniref:Extracellular solute-binding protein n=1 Tax=Angustibacter aerolatus TaxID=1162965 RepID=A0ABQ6JLL8_9ACTN|nr:hypothetical protein [Angustibacter aerolatus]GMA89160.1 hypothetical protein GCM10025868_44100 [Angustibacter aerolatus]